MAARHWTGSLLAIALLSGCAGKPTAAPTVLRTEDFIADPATMPTALPAAPTTTAAPSAPGRPITPVSAAREGIREVAVVPGPPAAPVKPAAGVDTPVLIDAKVGEINGRAIRAQDILVRVEDRLRAAVRNSSGGDRSQWLALAANLIRIELYGILRDELLAAEARAELKPEQRQGLRYFVQEATENKRRSLGGSQAELERSLRASSQNAQRFGKDIEARILIQRQIDQKVANRTKATWKDIVRYYNRHADDFRPPAIARFRLIVVSADNAAAVETIQKALDAGEPFEKVAALPENQWSGPGGLFGDGKTEVGASIAETSAFAFDGFNEAARKLTPGKHSPQITRVDRDGKTTVNWLYLESVESRVRHLSDPDVQLGIADKLNEAAKVAGTGDYIARLVQRATFTDLDTMTESLVSIAAERYWPAGR